MRYIERDRKTKKIIGHYANEQPHAKEAVPDDHPDIIAFTARRDVDRNAAFDRRRDIDSRLKALEKRIEALEKLLAEKGEEKRGKQA